MKPLFLFTILFLTYSVSVFAGTTPPSACEKALVKAADIQRKIEETVAPLKAGKGYILSEAGLAIDVADAINRELAIPIFEDAKKSSAELIQKISREWGVLFNERIVARYQVTDRTYKKFHSLSNEVNLDEPLPAKVSFDQKTGIPKIGLFLLDLKRTEESLKAFMQLNQIGSTAQVPWRQFEARLRKEYLADYENLVLDDLGLPQKLELIQFDRRFALKELEEFKKQNASLDQAHFWFQFERTLMHHYRGAEGIARAQENGTNGLGTEFDFFKNFPEVSALVYDLKTEGRSKNIGASEIEKAIVQALLYGLPLAKGNDSPIAKQIVRGVLKQKTADAFNTKAGQIINAVGKFIGDTLGEKTPDWSQIQKAKEELIDSYFHLLEEKFPLMESQHEKKERLLAEALKPVEMIFAQEKNGVVGIELKSLKIKAYYDTDLATTVYLPLKEKDYSNPGVILVLDHGAGTVKSNAASWKYMIPLFEKYGFNPVAMNLPNTGIGIQLKTYPEILAYLDYRGTILRQKAESAGAQVENLGVDPKARPLVLLGRSMGAQSALAVSVYNFNSPFDFFVESSFSNPFTTELQTKNVLEMFEKGLIAGVSLKALEEADYFSREFLLDLLAKAKRNPSFLKDIADRHLFLQGNSDEDGGITVMLDLVRFIREFVPDAHYYAFADKLRTYKIEGRDMMDPEDFEGTHFTFSNKTNLPTEIARKAFPAGIKDHHFPRLADQTFEAIDSIYEFIDYRADVDPALAKYREDFLTAQKTSAKGFGEWFRFLFEISTEGFEKAKPGNYLNDDLSSSNASRAKRVNKYWELRRVKRATKKSL